jgi:hypothetical protein
MSYKLKLSMLFHKFVFECYYPTFPHILKANSFATSRTKLLPDITTLHLVVPCNITDIACQLTYHLIYCPVLPAALYIPFSAPLE